jgi:hypothetical protein
MAMYKAVEKTNNFVVGKRLKKRSYAVLSLFFWFFFEGNKRQKEK